MSRIGIDLVGDHLDKVIYQSNFVAPLRYADFMVLHQGRKRVPRILRMGRYESKD